MWLNTHILNDCSCHWMDLCIASLCISCLCCLTGLLPCLKFSIGLCVSSVLLNWTINVYEYSCTWLVCAPLITSEPFLSMDVGATQLVCALHFTSPNFDKFLCWWYMQFMFSPDLNIWICQKKMLHMHLALFIQLFISEIIWRITNCLFCKCKYNITHIFYNLYQYRTINKYSNVKYSYCFILVIHAYINLLESFACGYLFLINCFSWYNSVVTASFINFGFPWPCIFKFYSFGF